MSRRPAASATDGGAAFRRALAATLAALAALLCACGTAVAQEVRTATLSAAFDPLRLGQRTTLDFGFSFSAPAGEVPPPLTQIELLYPSNLGIGLSGLGLATCRAPALEASGLTGCAPNSIMGHGVVLTGIVLGSTKISETAPITVLRAPDRQGRLSLLFFAEGTKPVSTTVIFSGLLLPAPIPFGGRVHIGVPLVPTLPGAPDVSVVNMHSTLGPKGVIYYERADGATLAYRPRGILLPPRCPRHGFPFAADFTFADGTSAKAQTVIRCPHGGSRRPRYGAR